MPNYSAIGAKCRQLVVEWHAKQYNDPLGPINRGLYDRVGELLRRHAANVSELFEGEYIALAAEIRGVSSSGDKQVPKPKKRRGRKSSQDRDAKIYNEYCNGQNDGKWATQTAYLQKMHAARWKKGENAAKSWLSQLIKRVEEKPGGVK